MARPATKGFLTFGVDARHLQQLGRELVSDRVTAVSELVKNAYDADATEVEIEFQDAFARGGVLEIRDNGSGMTLADIENRWMRISTAHKQDETRSTRFRRIRAGQKGIGRFATESLGSKLVLTSTVRGSNQAVRATFDWADFAPGVDLDSIRVLYAIEDAQEGAHGTTLRIEALRDAWQDTAVERLRQNLVLLQPPMVGVGGPPAATSGDPGIAIRFIVQKAGSRIETGGLEDFFAAATAVITGVVDEDGVATMGVQSERLDLTRKNELGSRLLTVGPFEFRSYYYVYQRDAIGSIALRAAQQMGNQFGGVRLYRDGMRVPPYGDRGDDWLGLDGLYRRRTILYPLGNVNFFGSVFISRDTNLLIVDTASREGVVENDAFGELREFVRGAAIWGASAVAAVRESKKPPPPPPAEEPTRSREEIVDELIAAVEAEDDELSGDFIASLRTWAGAQARAADEQERRVAEQLAGEVELLRVLASLGTSIAVFSHEVRGVLHRASGALGDVEDKLRENDVEGARLYVADVGAALARLEDLGDFIDLYLSRTRRRAREPQPVFDVVRSFFDAFGSILEARNVHVDWTVDPPHVRTKPMTRSELEAILFNLLTNAVKAMDGEGSGDRSIRLSVSADDARLALRFEDAGRGIASDIATTLFEPFVTTSVPGETELGTGTGLGLKIVRDIALAYGGDVAVVQASKGFTTAFELHLPVEGEE